jgi:hypothetical protein
MSGLTLHRSAGLLCVALMVSPRIASAQDSLAAARDLYVSADYENALAMLGRLPAADAASDERRGVDEYRAFCLLALGRKADAEETIQALVFADPMYRPSEADASPRVRAAFTEVRRQLLPALVQRGYAQAKSAFDGRDYQKASREFSQTLDWLSDPDLGTAATAPPLADLRVLVAGFLDLTRQVVVPTSRAVLPPQPSLEVAPPAVEVAPPDRVASDRPSRDQLIVYTIESQNIVPPVAVRESLPTFRGRLTSPLRGELELVIDEMGAVSFATMRTSVNAGYDKQILSVTPGWRYRPATLDGVPVKYRKMIEVSIIPQ